MIKYILCPIFILIIVFTNITCVSRHNSINDKEKLISTSRERPKEIEISFKLNKEDFNYSFYFLNLSKDTFSIAVPKPANRGNTGGYFQLFDESLYTINKRCASIHTDVNTDWIMLLPGKKEIIKSSITLEQIYCQIKDSYSLGYNYLSFIKDANGIIFGTCNFDIQPTMISQLDSIVLKKFIF